MKLIISLKENKFDLRIRDKSVIILDKKTSDIICIKILEIIDKKSQIKHHLKYLKNIFI